MKRVIRYRRIASDFPVMAMGMFGRTPVEALGKRKIFVVQTGSRIVQRCILMTTDPGDLVL